MADYERVLTALGAVPAGARPKTILAGDENQEPGYYQTDPLSNMVRALKARQLDIEEKAKKQMEKAQKKADMYKTLREAGYDPTSAYEATQKDQFPDMAGGNDVGNKTSREKILAKIEKNETLSSGEQQVYDETIKHGSADNFASAVKAGINDIKSGKRKRNDVIKSLYEDYPEKTSNIQTLRKQLINKTNVVKPGSAGYINPDFNIAFDRKKTAAVGSKIQTEEDLEELKSMKKEYEAAGVDVDFIINNFGG